MFDNFYISNEYIGEYISLEEINEINNSVKTKEPLITTDLGIGDASIGPVLIDVGIGLISAISYDLLKYIVKSIKEKILKRHNDKYHGEPSPDLIFRIDGNTTEVHCSFVLSSDATDVEVDKKIQDMKLISNLLKTRYGICDNDTDVL